VALVESGTRIIVYVDPSVPESEAHERVADARARLDLEPVDVLRADAMAAREDASDRELVHLVDISPGERTGGYTGVWATLDELEALEPPQG
jgi:hypothetical protein